MRAWEYGVQTLVRSRKGFRVFIYLIFFLGFQGFDEYKYINILYVLKHWGLGFVVLFCFHKHVRPLFVYSTSEPSLVKSLLYFFLSLFHLFFYHFLLSLFTLPLTFLFPFHIFYLYNFFFLFPFWFFNFQILHQQLFSFIYVCKFITYKKI